MPANDYGYIAASHNHFPEKKFSSDSPPSMSPPDSPTEHRDSCDWSTAHTSYQSETTINDSGVSSTGLRKDLHATKQALCEMDIPEHLVDLAMNIYHMRHQQYPSAVELYPFALEIAMSPELQCNLSLQWHQEELRQAEMNLAQANAESSSFDSLDSLEEDGMEVESSNVSNSSLKDEVDCAAPNWKSFSAEMPESPKADSVATSQATQIERLEQLHAENKKLKNRKVCRVCRKVELAVSGVTFLPCGHFITCEECAEKCDDCPACGKSIMGTVRTFLA